MSAGVQFEVELGGTWRDLVARDQVLAGQAVTIRRGSAGVGEAPRPAIVTARLDNTDDSLRPSNPESDLYQTAGVGTPIRVSRDGEVRGYLRASAWEADETSDFRRTPKRGSAWIGVTGGGLMEQIISSPALQSPSTRYVKARTTNVGHWPCEEESGATALSNTTPGGSLGKIRGAPSIGSSDSPLGSSASIKGVAGSTLSGTFSAANADMWRVSFQARIPATLTASYLPFFTWVDSVGRFWSWEVNNANYAIRVVDADGTSISFEVMARSETADQWSLFTITAVVSGITLEYDAERTNDSVSAGIIKTFATTNAGNLRTWSRPDNAYTVDMGFCQVYGQRDIGDIGQETAAFQGHRGEPASWRFARVMEELGFAWDWIQTPEYSTPMGPQQAGTVAELLREIQDTEDALIYDARDELKIIMRDRFNRMNLTPFPMYLSDLTARPREVNSSSIANVVTAQNKGGAESTAVDVTGPLGVTAKGTLEKSVSVSAYPDRYLDQIANWYLRRFTINQPRYPVISVQLNALDAARAAQIRALDIGEVIELYGVQADPVRLHILAIDETIGWPNEHRLVFTCDADDMFDVGVYDTARYDSSSTTLAAAAEIGQTSLSLTTVKRGDAWSTTVPYLAECAGERVTVTGMTAPSGSGPFTQTATVARSANGVRKRLPAGAEFHVVERARYAFKGEL